MANRNFAEFSGSLEKGLVNLFVVVNQTGATTIQMQAWNPNTKVYQAASAAGFRGVKSVTRTGVGAWTVVLQDSYQRIIGLNAFSRVAGGLAAAPVLSENTSTVSGTADNVQSNTTPAINLQWSQIVAGVSTATDPASGEQLVIVFTLQNSTAL